jgi:hypothetical protein
MQNFNAFSRKYHIFQINLTSTVKIYFLKISLLLKLNKRRKNVRRFFKDSVKLLLMSSIVDSSAISIGIFCENFLSVFSQKKLIVFKTVN